MARYMPHACRASCPGASQLLAGGLILLTWAGLAGEVVSQEKSPVTLFMVVRVKKGENPTIKKTMTQAADEQGIKLTDNDIDVKPVAPAFFETIAAYAGAGSPIEAGALEKSKVRVYPLMAVAPTWAMSFAEDSGRLIKELKVYFDNDKEPRTFTSDAKPKPGEDAWLAAVRPGREYTLRLPAGMTPNAYSMVYKDPLTGEEITEGKTPWPEEGDPYYLVTIRNFRGDLERLFKAAKDKDVCANPFADIRSSFDVRLYLGSIGMKLPASSIGFDENRLSLSQAPLENRSTKRVWVLFPIAEKDLEKTVGDLEKVAPENLHRKIRENGVTGEASNPTVSAKLGPKWYELPNVSQEPSQPPRFERAVILKDWRTLQEAYPKAFRVVVWEFDNGKEKLPIRVRDRGRDSMFKVEEIETWPQGIQIVKSFEEKNPPKE